MNPDDGEKLINAAIAAGYRMTPGTG